MSVFSTTFHLERILLTIEGKFHNILIIGCGGCINESIAFTNNLPIYKEDNGALIPIAINIELEKIRSSLTAKGFEVRTTSVPLGQNALCIRWEGNEFQYNPHSDFDPEVVLSLCCHAGTFGIRNSYDRAIPVIQITKQVGQMAYYYYVKDGKQWIDFDKSKVFYSCPLNS